MIKTQHLNELVDGSNIAPEIAALNFFSLQGYEPHERLFYGLPDSDRRNDGRIRDSWLKKYAHCESGGWWVSSVNLLSENLDEDDNFGQFKPNCPRTPTEYTKQGHFKKQKLIKYETPPKAEAGVIALRSKFLNSWKIARKLNEKAQEEWVQRFWEAIEQKAPEVKSWQTKSDFIRAEGVRGSKKLQFSEEQRYGDFEECRATNREAEKPAASCRKLQEACQRREYEEIDIILQQELRNRSTACEFKSKNSDSRGIERLISLVDRGFWKWVKENPEVPIIITEGGKKAASLLTAGYVVVALPGINMGYRTSKDEFGKKFGRPYLIPQLQRLARKNREFTFCFDRDSKPKTVRNVNAAIARTGRLLEKEGCKVSVVTWDFPDKGVDDLIVNRGVDAFQAAYNARVSLSTFKLRWETSLQKYDPLIVCEQYLNSNKITIPEAPRLIGLKSAKGTNKTGFIATTAVKEALDRGERVIVLTHRQALEKELAERFGVDCRSEIRTSDVGGALGYALCFDSLHPHANPSFNPDEWRGATIIIDEAEQAIWHLLDSSTCQSNRTAIIQCFKQLLVTAVATGGKVWLADADLTPIAIEYIRALIGFPIETWMLENEYQPSKRRKLIAYDGNDPSRMVVKLDGAIRQGEKVLIHCSGQKWKSKWGTSNLHSRYRKMFPNKKILVLDRETVADPEHPAYGCMGHLNDTLKDYDIVICSPVIETGVSIDLKGHFNSVWCIAWGNQPVDSVAQAIARLRDDVIRHVWLKSSAKNMTIGNGAISSKALKYSQHKLSQTHLMSLRSVDDEEFREPGEYRLTDYPSEETWAKRAALINLGKLNYRGAILNKLKEEGYEIEDLADLSKLQAKETEELADKIKAETNLKQKQKLEKELAAKMTTEEEAKQEIKQASDYQKEIRKENHRVYCEEVSAVEIPTDTELEHLKKKRAKTKIERLKERNGSLAKSYEVAVTAKLVERDDNGWYSQLRLNYYFTVGREHFLERDRRSLKSLAGENQKAFTPDINKRLIATQISAMEVLGIGQYLNYGLELTHKDLAEFEARCKAMRWDIKSILGVGINDRDKGVKILNRILKKLDHKFKSVGWTGTGNDRRRVYKLAPLAEDDNREEIFSKWLERDCALAERENLVTV
ncbi:plasmid replication protein, CyRepA1 family [Myxosarcina sp. GI1]|uniref:plasmid replication protein, CyRepA1 family n=1 Tax=Myxosarcina sp. GI1 TaxID=1541065 RepID=UPI00068EB0AE|nr:plasmid replication protein, CyRepA1 family [Myxosarcina sp. GI1]